MARQYYTMITRDSDHVWSAEFGDYSRACVKEEMDDYADREVFAKKDMRIIKTGDAQQDIDFEIARINADWRNNA